MTGRVVDAALGLWLFFSAFMWSHTAIQRVNAWVVGMVVVTLAMADWSQRVWARQLIAAMGAWLIVSALFLSPTGIATFWNHVVVGFGMVLSGLTPLQRRVREAGHAPAHSS
jgi:hypothetical protein